MFMCCKIDSFQIRGLINAEANAIRRNCTSVKPAQKIFEISANNLNICCVEARKFEIKLHFLQAKSTR